MTKLSVVCVSYNHERFLPDTLNGFVQQKTNFPFEVIIADDASTDKSQSIIRTYANKYPKIFHTILREKNVGSMVSFRDALSKVTGEYVAICEGDDYWTDPNKLQKQVDFLDNHPEISFHFHEVKTVDVLRNTIGLQVQLPQDRVITLDEILWNHFIPTCSVVYRYSLPYPFPKWIQSLECMDLPLHVYHASKGNAYYSAEVMAVYNIHDGGVSKRFLLKKPRELEIFIEKRKLQYRFGIVRFLKFRAIGIMLNRISMIYGRLSRLYMQEGRTLLAKWYGLVAFLICPYKGAISLRELISFIFTNKTK